MERDLLIDDIFIVSVIVLIDIERDVIRLYIWDIWIKIMNEMI